VTARSFRINRRVSYWPGELHLSSRRFGVSGKPESAKVGCFRRALSMERFGQRRAALTSDVAVLKRRHKRKQEKRNRHCKASRGETPMIFHNLTSHRSGTAPMNGNRCGRRMP